MSRSKAKKGKQKKKDAPEAKAMTRAEILGLVGRSVHRLVVPDWDHAVVYVGELNGKELFAIRDHLEDKSSELDKRMAYIAAATLSDKNGNRLFTEKDVPELAKKRFGGLNSVMKKALEINGLSGDRDLVGE